MKGVVVATLGVKFIFLWGGGGRPELGNYF